MALQGFTDVLDLATLYRKEKLLNNQGLGNQSHLHPILLLNTCVIWGKIVHQSPTLLTLCFFIDETVVRTKFRIFKALCTYVVCSLSNSNC
jgi:hypothetical protein